MEEKLVALSIEPNGTVSFAKHSFSLQDIIGVRAVSSHVVEVAQCVESVTECFGSKVARNLELRQIKVQQNAETIVGELQCALRARWPAAPERLLVIANPTSGTGKALRLLDSSVRPVLESAGIKLDILVTSRRLEAMERCAALVRELAGDDLDTASHPDGIVVLGGDGTLSEVVRGLYAGCAELEDPGARRKAASVVRSIALAQVPAGSGNALANSIASACNDTASAVNAAYYVAKGATAKLDVARYELADGTVSPSFLSFEWAMLADIDLGSESLRCIGSARFQLAALYRICCLRPYRGRLAYLPATDATNESKTLFDTDFPSFDTPLPENWITIDEENFHLAVAVNLSHIDASTPLVPTARHDDGLLHLIWTAGSMTCATKVDLLDGFLKVDSGKHIDKPSIHVAACTAFRLEPASDDTSRAAIDGEEIPNAPIQAFVIPGALRIFCGAAAAALS